MNKFYWMAIGLLLGLVNLRAEIKLPALVGDNMVLQQATKVRLWGNATPNSSLKVRSSWDNTEYTAQVNDQGRWEIWVQTPSASFEKQQLTLENGQDKIVLHDLLIGEVWFGSGQSNMEMPLRGFWHCPIEGGNHAIATSGKYKNSIRYATIQRVGALEPKDYPVGGEWKVCDPRNAPEFGATAYFFATLLTEVLNVPVGIINCSWGGSTVEGWLPKDILRNYSDIDLSLAGNDEKIHPMLQPMIMYNGMLKPASKYTVRGFLWYQGESNVGHPDYAKRLATMVEHWRGLWGQGELPFYLVEIAPYEYGEGDQAAYLREEQYKATRLIPNSGIVSTNDLVQDYEKRQIHPKEKQKIGERLCYMALNKTYGYTTIACEGPQYDHMEIDKDGTIRFKEPEVFFSKGESELKTQFKDILDSFFPRYINVIYTNYKDKVTEIRIEGHTSSEWEEGVDTKTAYFKNMELSQDRTRNVLEYVMNMESLSEYENWLIDNITANGMSYSHRIYKDNVEDKDASRRVEFRVITNSEETINEIIDNYKK